MKLQT
jgi:hypothetical protein